MSAGTSPLRDAVALLLADLDGDAERAHAILAPWADREPEEIGALLRALVRTARHLGTHYAEKDERDLRGELKILAEGLALEG